MRTWISATWRSKSLAMSRWLNSLTQCIFVSMRLRRWYGGQCLIVDQQMQRAFRSTVGDVDGQGLLAPGQGAEVGHRPVEANQPQQALDEPSRLPERHAEQHLHREARLYGGIAVGLLPATSACRRGLPTHIGAEPDRQRAPTLERFIVGWPVPGLVGRGRRFTHAHQLPLWIHEMNPTRDLCNRAHQSPKDSSGIRSTKCRD